MAVTSPFPYCILYFSMVTDFNTIQYAQHTDLVVVTAITTRKKLKKERKKERRKGQKVTGMVQFESQHRTETHHHLKVRFSMNGPVPLLSLYAFVAWTGKTVPLPFFTCDRVSVMFCSCCLEFGHPRCVCNNEVKYNEGQKLRGLSPRANYTDRAAAAGRRSQCQLLRIEGRHVVSATGSHGR